MASLNLKYAVCCKAKEIVKKQLLPQKNKSFCRYEISRRNLLPCEKLRFGFGTRRTLKIEGGESMRPVRNHVSTSRGLCLICNRERKTERGGPVLYGLELQG